jgi:hypothetical protein
MNIRILSFLCVTLYVSVERKKWKKIVIDVVQWKMVEGCGESSALCLLICIQKVLGVLHFLINDD